MKKNCYLTSHADGLRLHILLMEPEESPRGIVQLCHGMMEHKERYEAFMEYLCRNGYVAVIHDHRGHGKSIRDEKDLGYFYDSTGTAIVKDAHLVTRWVKKKYPGLPLHLFGHSMGSLVVRCYLKKYDYELASVILCGSPSKNQLAGFGIFLAELFCLVNDRKTGVLFQKIVFGLLEQMSDQEELPNSWISLNKENVRKYNEDPMNGLPFSNNGFLNLFHLMANTYSKKGWVGSNPSLPILFLSGENDPCIGSKEQFAQAVDHMISCGYPNTSGILFPHVRHELLNEDEETVKKVYQTILEFLSSQSVSVS